MVASAEPKQQCEYNAASSKRSSNEIKEVYNVVLLSQSVKDNQLDWLKNCYNRTAGSSTKSIYDIKNKNFVKDVSVNGFSAYSAWFTADFANNVVKKKDGVTVVEKDGTMKVNYVVPRKKSTVFAVRVLGDDGSGNNADVISGLTFVLSQHAKSKTKNTSLGIKSDTDTAVLSGTSQAIPHVAGTIALIIAKNGNQSPAKMATTLKDLSSKNALNIDANAK
ncbi:8930_t:CDS:2, partial [Racocetra fulgida]